MERCVEYETIILRDYSGLSDDDYRAYYIELSPYCKLRTIEFGLHGDKPKLVFIHGYGAAGLMYWRIMKPLAAKYHCIFVDLPGMGSSTRVPFLPETVPDA